MGYGLPKEYCFEDRLEKRIQAELDKVIKPDSIFRDVEVINFGVNGYTTDQVRATLEKKALAYHPDILLHQVCENDVHEFYTNIILEQSVTSNLNEHYFQIWHVNDSDPGRLNRFIQASDLLRWVSASSRNIKMKRIAVKMRKLKKQILRDQYDEAFQLYSNELLKTAQIARLHGTYVLLIIPQWKEMKLKERSLFSERTIAFATANDIPFYELLFDMIDITDKLGIDRQELHIAHEDIPEDTHLNIQGSDLAAELIKHHLYRIGSLPIN
ncbi:hypothetical protein JXA80_07055 [bacterium]|nr:hypothetical protein [candidate division CSSED10-310 bacterium]